MLAVARTVAILAPVMNSVQLIPQLNKTWRRKSVRDISIYSLVLLLFVDILWLLHGWFIMDMPLIVSGLIQTACLSSLIAMYAWFL